MELLIRSQTHGDHFVQYDEIDGPIILAHIWHLKKHRNTFYAQTKVRADDGKWLNVKMHRMLLGINDPKKIIDHIDHNGLNNCRSNLRLASDSQNKQNSRKRSSNTSGFRGVTWSKKDKKWVAQIQIFGTHKYLGGFDTPEEASAAYEARAKTEFKEFYNDITGEEV